MNLGTFPSVFICNRGGTMKRSGLSVVSRETCLLAARPLRVQGGRLVTLPEMSLLKKKAQTG